MCGVSVYDFVYMGGCQCNGLGVIMRNDEGVGCYEE